MAGKRKGGLVAQNIGSELLSLILEEHKFQIKWTPKECENSIPAINCISLYLNDGYELSDFEVDDINSKFIKADTACLNDFKLFTRDPKIGDKFLLYQPSHIGKNEANSKLYLEKKNITLYQYNNQGLPFLQSLYIYHKINDKVIINGIFIISLNSRNIFFIDRSGFKIDDPVIKGGKVKELNVYFEIIKDPIMVMSISEDQLWQIKNANSNISLSKKSKTINIKLDYKKEIDLLISKYGKNIIEPLIKNKALYESVDSLPPSIITDKRVKSINLFNKDYYYHTKGNNESKLKKLKSAVNLLL